MSRTTISLPDDLVDELDEHCSDDMSRPEFFREVVLPALNGDHVEISIDGALSSEITEQLAVIEGKLDDNRTQIPSRTAQEIENTFR